MSTLDYPHLPDERKDRIGAMLIVFKARSLCVHCVIVTVHVRGIDDSMSEVGYYDEFGFYSPMPIDRAARREPDENFPTGPEIGSELPSICLSNQSGELIEVSQHRGARGTIIVFHRSAYW